MGWNVASKGARLKREGDQGHPYFQILKYLGFPGLGKKEEYVYVQGQKKEINTRMKCIFLQGLIVLFKKNEVRSKIVFKLNDKRDLILSRVQEEILIRKA